MREFKFRAWTGGFFEYSNFNFMTGCLGCNFSSLANGNPDQYTGIERGEREVYEGDIYYIAGTGNCVVSIDPYLGVMFTDSEGEESSWIDEIAENDIGDYLGNKYENPELLGDTE